MPETEQYTPTYAPDDAERITRDDLEEGSGSLYPAKLVECRKVLSDRQDGDTRPPVLQMYQVFERCDQVWPDGNPVLRRNRLNLQYVKRADGKVYPMWPGSPVDQVGEAFSNLVGCDLFPDSAETASFVGHYFMLSDVKVPDTERFYLRIPVEYLGEEFEYEGDVTTLNVGDGSGDAPAPPEEDGAIPRLVAGMLDGLSEEDIRKGAGLKLVGKTEELADVQTVLGKSLRGGLVQPKAILLDALLEEGYLVVEEGVVKAVAEEA
jgi:hypothetical protein